MGSFISHFCDLAVEQSGGPINIITAVYPKLAKKLRKKYKKELKRYYKMGVKHIEESTGKKLTAKQRMLGLMLRKMAEKKVTKMLKVDKTAMRAIKRSHKIGTFVTKWAKKKIKKIANKKAKKSLKKRRKLGFGDDDLTIILLTEIERLTRKKPMFKKTKPTESTFFQDLSNSEQYINSSLGRLQASIDNSQKIQDAVNKARKKQKLARNQIQIASQNVNNFLEVQKQENTAVAPYLEFYDMVVADIIGNLRGMGLRLREQVPDVGGAIITGMITQSLYSASKDVANEGLAANQDLDIEEATIAAQEAKLLEELKQDEQIRKLIKKSEQIIRMEGKVDTGKLVGGFVVSYRYEGDRRIATVSNEVEYAKYINHGASDGAKRFVSFKVAPSLYDWFIRKQSINVDSQGKHIAQTKTKKMHLVDMSGGLMVRTPAINFSSPFTKHIGNKYNIFYED